MRTATMAVARGSTANATAEYIRRTYGEPTLAAIMERLDAPTRSLVVNATMTADLPYDVLLAFWRSADVSLAPTSPDWAESAGAFAIESVGQKLYGGLLRKASPMEFVTQSVSLFQLYYAPGDMEVVEVTPGRAVLRLVGFPSLGALFCRRQTGGLRRAAEIAGGRLVRVAHVRCEQEGDAYCEWEVRWEATTVSGGA